MELKHTPGPWVVPPPVADNSGTYGAMVFSVYAYNGTHIYDKRILNKHVDEHKANAQLIAASPDMLQALINVRERLLEVLVAAEHPEIFIEINDAIKKATP